MHILSVFALYECKNAIFVIRDIMFSGLSASIVPVLFIFIVYGHIDKNIQETAVRD